MKTASKSTDVKNTNQDQYMAAVQQNAWALEYVPEAVQRDNPDIPLAAVQKIARFCTTRQKLYNWLIHIYA